MTSTHELPRIRESEKRFARWRETFSIKRDNFTDPNGNPRNVLLEKALGNPVPPPLTIHQAVQALVAHDPEEASPANRKDLALALEIIKFKLVVLNKH